jgi:hypothetical protein
MLHLATKVHPFFVFEKENESTALDPVVAKSHGREVKLE